MWTALNWATGLTHPLLILTFTFLVFVLKGVVVRNFNEAAAHVKYCECTYITIASVYTPFIGEGGGNSERWVLSVNLKTACSNFSMVQHGDL